MSGSGCDPSRQLRGGGRRPRPLADRETAAPAGLSPKQYESAGKRRDGAISREGSVELRRALIDLGIGPLLNDHPSRGYAAGLKQRGKRCGIIACSLAHRANRIAVALVRDQAVYDPSWWG